MPLHSISIIFIGHCLFDMTWISQMRIYISEPPLFSKKPTSYDLLPFHHSSPIQWQMKPPIPMMNLRKVEDFSHSKEYACVNHSFFSSSFSLHKDIKRFTVKSANSITIIITLKSQILFEFMTLVIKKLYSFNIDIKFNDILLDCMSMIFIPIYSFFGYEAAFSLLLKSNFG